MKIPLATCLILTLGLTHPVNMLTSAAPEVGSVSDLDGSGSESGSGSGDWSDLGESANNVEFTNTNSRMFDSTHWPKKDSEKGYIILENNKSHLSDKQVVAAIIGGSVTGVVMSAVMLAIVIYVRHNKDTGGCFLSDTEQVI